MCRPRTNFSIMVRVLEPVCVSPSDLALTCCRSDAKEGGSVEQTVHVLSSLKSPKSRSIVGPFATLPQLITRGTTSTRRSSALQTQLERCETILETNPTFIITSTVKYWTMKIVFFIPAFQPAKTLFMSYQAELTWSNRNIHGLFSCISTETLNSKFGVITFTRMRGS